MDEAGLKRLDEFLNKIILFQSDVQEFRRMYKELLEAHAKKKDEVAAIEATIKARKAEHESHQAWVLELVDKLKKAVPQE